MITKTKHKFIAAILAVVLAASILITVNIAGQFASASAAYMPTPQITVLTHGWANFNGASHWSHDQTPHEEDINGNGKIEDDEYFFHFNYDTDSIIHKISQKAGGANIYWAKMHKVSLAYDLYSIGSGSNYDNYRTDYYVAWQNGKLSSTSITDVSKHIIIVFEASNGEASNYAVYKEFENMLNGVISQVKARNPGQANPKVNLIGHSRGGITNLQYALDYAENVHSMISVGTPYFGSPACVALGEMLFGPSAALNDTNNAAVYNSYYDRWKNGYESRYRHINAIAVGGYTTIDFLQAALVAHGDTMSNALASILTLYESFAGQILLHGVGIFVIDLWFISAVCSNLISS